ncbi:carbohydrate-binding module family 13 protein [Rhizophagus irregularis DAOM 181602=DAOM 197198]|nr:carbohydrate-binding module family 13 protein [Rhizophagus irregularis DAOM 181602=DAOM 197198]
MADNKFLPRLSQNLLEILDDKEYYDITIEVGSDTYVKKNDGILTHIKLPNVSPDFFHVLLRYVYGGRLSLEEYDISDIIKILVTANELSLQDFETDSFPELRKYCTNLISKEPDKIFNSPNFSSIPERLLITLIQKDELQMKEIQVWEHVIKWGLAQNPELPSDPTSFSKDDFNTLKHTLHHCIPFIRFRNITSREFLKKVKSYKKILPKELYNDLLEYFLDNDSEESLPRISILKQKSTLDISRVTNSDKESQENVPTERLMGYDNILLNKQKVLTNSIKNIDSKIITFQHTEIISKWIDRLEITDKLTNLYEFKLLYRHSRDRSSGILNRFKKFHEICVNQPHTVTFAKVEGSNEILGGYNPIGWEFGSGYDVTKDSFIFSFNNYYSVENYILSRVKNEKEAISKISSLNQGPSFGGDFTLFRSFGNKLEFYCKNTNYEKPISKISSGSTILEFELFKIDI